MIDPTKITNYNLNTHELQEHLMFWVCAAGKNGVTAAKCLDKLLRNLKVVHTDWQSSPFNLVNKTDLLNFVSLVKQSGIGCFNSKAKAFRQMAMTDINLETCSVEQLEALHGVGPKTARCFLIHSRPNQELAGLDVHILRFLKDKGYDVPKSTPSGKRYREVEKHFIKEAKKSGMSIADFDLKIWNEYREK